MAQRCHSSAASSEIPRSFSASAPEPSRRRAQQAGLLGDRQRGLPKTKAPPSMTKEGFFERRVRQITRCIIPGLRSATTATEAANPTSPQSILPPEGQAWFNGLNPFCRWAVEYDLRNPDLFVKYWESLRDTLQSSNVISVLPITGSTLPG